MGGNKKILPSAITILENGDAYIGDRAFRSDILKKHLSMYALNKLQKILMEKRKN